MDSRASRMRSPRVSTPLGSTWVKLLSWATSSMRVQMMSKTSSLVTGSWPGRAGSRPRRSAPVPRASSPCPPDGLGRGLQAVSRPAEILGLILQELRHLDVHHGHAAVHDGAAHMLLKVLPVHVVVVDRDVTRGVRH